MSLASLEELQARLPRTIASAQEDRAQACLDDASTLVNDAGGEEWTELTIPATAKVVVLTAAKRAFLNPEGLTSAALGDATHRFANSSVYLTKEERSTVRTAAGKLGVGHAELFGDLPVSQDFQNAIEPFDINDES
jgi:hypothetical protein